MTIEVENVDEADDDDWARELRNRRLRFHRNSEGHVHAMVQSRMKTLQLDVQRYSQCRQRCFGHQKCIFSADTLAQKRNISFVLINPAAELELQVGDIIYLVRAPVAENINARRIDPRSGLKRKTSRKKSSNTLRSTAQLDGDATAANSQTPSNLLNNSLV